MPDILWWLGAAVLMVLAGFLFFLSPALDSVKAKQTIRRRSTSFYQAFSMLPDKTMRRAVFAVYAFCRSVDDAVDIKRSVSALEEIEKDFLQAIEGQRVKHWMFAELMKAAETYYPEDYDYMPYFDMIQGQHWDLNHKPFQTMKQLIEYSALVAGTVGRMLNPILAGEETSERKQFAIDLGIAMQLTNILRDIGEDDSAGRRYIPEELLLKHAVDWNSERHNPPSEAFVGLLEEVLEMAKKRYDSALSNLSLYPLEVQIPLGMSIVGYRAILHQIKQNGYDVFVRRAVVSDEEKRRLAELWQKTGSLGEKQ